MNAQQPSTAEDRNSEPPCVIQRKRWKSERERSHLFPHIPFVEGILGRALDSEKSVRVTTLSSLSCTVA